jgi:hypothetical protein
MFAVNDYIQRTQDLVNGQLNPNAVHLLILDEYQCPHEGDWRYKIKIISKQPRDIDESTVGHFTAHKYFTKIH